MEKLMQNINFDEKIKNIISQNIKDRASYYNIRNSAFDLLGNMNLPTLKHESWKYHNLTFLNKIDFELATNTNKINQNTINEHKIEGIDSYLIAVINGYFNQELSNVPQNIIINKLSDNNIKEFGSINNDQHTYFSLINTILFDEGLYIEIPKNTVIDKPIHILYFNDSTEKSQFLNQRRFFKFNDNTEATIIENFISLGENPAINNTVAEIIVGENSIINHYKLQQDNKNSIIFDFVQAIQSKYSNYINLAYTYSGAFVRNNIISKLNAENCESHFLGVFLGDGDNVIDNHTLVEHNKPNCFSNENYRGILFDKSTGIFNGKIYVAPDAQKTNAYQSNKNLLASPNATINTKPELEIYADDVKCSHGATSGTIEKESLFYLQTRGIDKLIAESILMNSFVSEVINEINNDKLKKYLKKLTRKKLNEDLHFIDEIDIFEEFE